ncbi:hypothetical protein [Halolamina salina]|uniref:Uncharacterized protein n=1 Tax=Halolamina salina TaxID=1220023 RepID=A0ABD6B1L0_9EURY
MQRSTLPRLIVTALLLGSVFAASGTPVAASTADPETADEYLAALQEYEEAPALETYSEFEVMRSQAITAVQVGEFTATDRERMAAILATLETFTDAYAAAQNGSVAESVTIANRTAEAIDRVEAADGGQYATLARLGLERFYRQQGDTLYERGRSAENTSAKIRYFEAAATALERGGATTQFSRVSAELSQTEATFEADKAELETAVSLASSFRADCGESCASPVAAMTGLGPAVFGHYRQAREANAASDTASQIVDRHSISQDADRVAQLSEWTNQAMLSLVIASTLLLFGYALLIVLLVAPVAARIATWSEDLERAQVGRIVPADSVEVGES